MRAGTLNKVVSIEAPPTDDADGDGQAEGSWTAVLSDIAANILIGNGSDQIRGGEPMATLKASVRIRYRENVVQEGMRVKHVQGGVTTLYAIRAIAPDEQHREYMDLVCEVIE